MSKESQNKFAEIPGILGMKGWLFAAAVIIFLHFTLQLGLNAYYFQILMFAGINITLAVSLNLVNGFTGQFSMGHAGFMSVGGYMSSYLTTTYFASNPDILQNPIISGVIFFFALIAGGVAATLAGYVVGLPSLRLRGDYLAIVTLGFGEIIRVLLLNMNIVGGARGMSGIQPLTNFFWVFIFALLTVFCVWRVVHSAKGRVLLAIREDEIAGTSMGVNTTEGKVWAFSLGAFFAGIAGGLFAHYLTTLNPGTFDFNRSFEIIIMVVLGGMGSISGSIVAAIFLTLLKEVLRPLQQITGYDLRMIIYSLVLIGMMLTRPQGIFGTSEITSLFNYFKKRLKRGAP